ncbi:MAG: DUF2807 domain-containing protein [Bacteroidetes bacterium]|nr:DUF2807 domain-containing protein [Bacteroidota bacterium]HET6245853.1 head GIN domain-containing protein [Bacteroidia bacterium]
MNIFKKITLASILISALLTASCNDCVKGEGEPVIKTLVLESFNAIHLTGSWGVTVTQGVEQKVEIIAPENIIHLLNTDIKNNTWDIAFKECVRTKKIEINIITPSIEAITVTGSGNVKSLNNLNVSQMRISVAGSGDIDLILNSREVSTDISGSGNVKLSGSATNFVASITGSGDIEAADFITLITKIKTIGSGNASIHATELVEATITGSGDIKYKDTGAKVISEITGSGEIVKK